MIFCKNNMNFYQKVKIAWFGKHFGEEPPLVGKKHQGSGTIFFSSCHFRCVFCQNYQISQEGIGQNYSVGQLAEMMLRLQKDSAVNINLVSPTIWWQEIKTALIIAKEKGLTIPIVWNSNAYESVHIIQEMKNLIDIYLPDFKYGIDLVGQKYSGVKNYTQFAIPAIREMLKQVGHLLLDDNNLAMRGLIVRHLILPNNLNNSFKALAILADIDANLAVSLMNQYNPLYRAADYSEINRKLSDEEFEKVFRHLLDLGLENGWVQEQESGQSLIPDFTKQNPFYKSVTK